MSKEESCVKPTSELIMLLLNERLLIFVRKLKGEEAIFLETALNRHRCVLAQSPELAAASVLDPDWPALQTAQNAA